MSYTRKFESFKKTKSNKEVVTPKPKKENSVNESSEMAGNVYKVVITVDVPNSLVSSYTKKVKDTFDKDITSTYGKASIAEELVRFVTMNYMNVDAIHAGALTGDPDPAQAQAQMVQTPMAQVQPQGQVAPQAQVQVPQGQGQGLDLGQGQAQVQVPQGQGQAQVQVPQGQGQAQAQVNPDALAQAQAQVPPAQGEFEEVQDDDEERDEDEALPL
jgi:hypothetical protein